MTWFERKFNATEKTLGSLKFAVVIMIIMSLSMIVGTFCESYYGTDFAARFIYKKWPFMLVQVFILLSIIFAAYRRLPPKKRLYGFYTIHAGLITIGAGSFITYHAGIDGSLFLPPKSPSREIILNKDQFKIIYPDDNREVKLDLPYTAFQTNIDSQYQNIKIGRYIPFAENKFIWSTPKSGIDLMQAHSSSYLIANEMVQENMTLSLHPESVDFKSSLTMGLMEIHYLPSSLASCFAQNTPSKIILWDGKSNECFTPEDKKIKIQKATTGRRFFVVEREGELLSFFPEASPWPMDSSMKTITSSSLRVFSKTIFEDKAHLFLFGKDIAYYDKDEKTWMSDRFTSEKKNLELPWMNFQLSLLEHHENKVPTYIPESVLPIQSNNEIIKGGTRAIEIIVDGHNYWVTTDKPLQLLLRGKKTIFSLQKQSVFLPFEIVLDRFKMNTDPGTNKPASYESFVRLFSNSTPEKHHIFMNNPMKFDGFTFYQASYSQDQQGNYSSTLSVNVDPGRFFKYLGSLMLVFGSMWHYYLNYRKKKTKPSKPLLAGVAT